jgi:hypothetical protein
MRRDLCAAQLMKVAATRNRKAPLRGPISFILGGDEAQRVANADRTEERAGRLLKTAPEYSLTEISRQPDWSSD